MCLHANQSQFLQPSIAVRHALPTESVASFHKITHVFFSLSSVVRSSLYRCRCSQKCSYKGGVECYLVFDKLLEIVLK